MVGFTVEFDEFDLEVLTDGFHDGPHPHQVSGSEDIMTVFRHEDQMAVERENAMSAGTDTLFINHKPSVEGATDVRFDRAGRARSAEVVAMSQKVKILGFKVIGAPFLGTTDDGVNIFTRDGAETANWLADASRARYNQCRSTRSKYVYADGVRLLNPDGTPQLKPIGDTVSSITHADARRDFPWMAAVPSGVLHYQLRNEAKAWFGAAKRRNTNRAARRPAGDMPGFRSRKHSPQTFGVFVNTAAAPRVIFTRTGRRSGIVVFGGINPAGATAPSTGRSWSLRIRVRFSQPINAFTSVQVNIDSRELTFSSPPPPRPHHSTGAIAGLDLGTVIDIATSDGGTHRRPRVATLIRELKIAQRAMARSRLTALAKHRNFWESHRYQTNKAKTAALHARITRIQTDWRHKTTTTLVNTYDVIVIEDLKVRNMTRSGRRKRGMNRVMAAASPATLREMLTYKTAAAGVALIAVAAHYTSQRCHTCGHIESDNRESQAVFRCKNTRCGWTGNADYNAAQNILDRGTETWDGTRPKRVRPHKTTSAPARTATAARPRQPLLTTQP